MLLTIKGSHSGRSPHNAPIVAFRHLLTTSKMSQYSLSTCDPIQKKKEDFVNVCKTPQVAGSVSTVLFETGTMDTFMSSLENTKEGVWWNAERAYQPPRPGPKTSSDISSSAGDETESLLTPTRSSFGVIAPMLGGVVVDSPSVSRAGTMDSAELSLAERQESSASNSPTVPSRTSALKRTKRPSPLRTQTPVREVLEAPNTPASTPTSPSAFRRAVGALVKSIRQ
ncbi:hypothetical protein C8Q73DRAFT_294186 [Cubamyces lactineus]|nr:hypothetical protein C8Q73DRAFT_294186 [Cubamyces lactineus]